ncbi:MAG TPA: acetate--CoA ligase [Steroidobacteraceae bacterium]|nr:acetate--CoA ligase [Steroidobacteraceae bacterium]
MPPQPEPRASFAPIPKPVGGERLRPYLESYAAACRSFSWQEAQRELSASSGGSLNIAHAAVDRHVESGRGAHLAARFIDRNWARIDLTYGDLRSLSNRLAGVLESLGVRRSDCVATLLGRVPELYLTALGTLKLGAIYCPLFSAFGPEPLKTRLQIGRVRVLVTSDTLFRRKAAAVRAALPELERVLIVRDDPGAPLPPDTLELAELMAHASDEFHLAATRADDIALLHFTSGTTGKPKGVLHAHGAVIAHHATTKLALDLHPEDIYWCTADPGWVTGISYGLIGPLTRGATLIVDREEFDPQRWYRLLTDEKVSVWYTAPTAIRMLMKAGVSLAHTRTYSALRFMASVGEPLNAEAVVWGMEAFGLPFHDTWWQTETGAIILANYAACEVRPGSMGLAFPGVEARIVRRRADGGVDLIDSPDEVGEIALRPGWPSMFRGYLDDDARYRACFVDGWYLSGDLARRDRDGYFWFVSRADDVIKSAGHLISPFEVESTLMTHPAVAQVGVIGLPDPIAGQSIKAFVELKSDATPGAALERSLMAHARKLLGAAIAPREIVIVESLPRTRSGKIMRRLLRARELGLPEGDLSTLEGAS